MVSSSQKRILTWLIQFSPSIEKSWDVTRSISLPGISEGLGVVRSALNNPLKKLEQDGMVFNRMAHVIGGGSRRRKVYHLTEKGREFISKNVSKKPKKANEAIVFGNLPEINQIYGREDLVKNTLEKLDQSSLLISGLPGIGKTTLVAYFCREFIIKNKGLRWATATEFSDILDICHQWGFSEPLPKDNIAIQEHISQIAANQLLIIDDIHLVSTRHLQAFKDLCNNSANSKSPKLIFIGREPLVDFPNMEKVKVEPLDEDSGSKILGEELPLEVRKSVSRRLGGHPLALQLHHPESELPEASVDIQKYVEETVLSHLGKQEKGALNLLSLEPMPIESSKSLISELIGLFDDQALLKWSSKNTKMELHHLIRNVKRSALDISLQRELHEKLARHWEGIVQSNEDNLILLYHQISSSQNDLFEIIERQLENLLPSNSNALAVLIEQALENKPDNPDLNFLAAKVAIERSEVDFVKKYLEFIDSERAIGINLELAFIEGRIEDAEQLILESFKNSEQNIINRLAISAASRRLDDRVFDQKADEKLIQDVNRYISHVKIDNSLESSKSASIVALTMIKHSLALFEGKIDRAMKLTNTLDKLGIDAETLVLNLHSKEDIFRLRSNQISLEEAIKSIEKAVLKQNNPLYINSIRLNLVEALIPIDLEIAKQQFDLLTGIDSNLRFNTYQRYVARWWLCKSILYPHERLSCLRESISQHRTSGCSRAAKALEKRLHELI